MRRKLFSITLAYMSGIIICKLAIDSCTFVVVFLAILTIALCVKFFDIGRSCIFAVVAGALMFFLFTFQFEMGKANDYIGQKIELEGVIVEAEKGADGKFSYVCKINKIISDDSSSNKSMGKILIRDKDGKISFSTSSGAVIRFTCVVEKPQQLANPNMFNYRVYLYSRGISVIGDEVHIIDFEESKSFFSKVENGIIGLRERFLASLHNDNLRAIFESVVFGCSKVLEEDVYYTFQMNGTAHVLAVSGLHIGVLYGCYATLKRKTGSRLLTLAFVIFLLVYGTCSMWAVSVKRAIVLIMLKLLAVEVDRPFDLVTATSFAALLICMLNPYGIFAVGFQLSFLAVCILAFVPRAVERVGMNNISGAIIIQVMLAPYICYVFNYFSLSGFIANVPIIFLISIFVPLGIAYFLIYALLGISVPIIEKVLNGLGQMTVQVNEALYFDGRGNFDVASGKLFAIVLIYLVLFFVTSENFSIDYIRKNGEKLLGKVLVLFFAVMLVFVGNYRIFGQMNEQSPAYISDFDRADFVFLDMMHGDCMHVKFDKKKDILIDGGGRQNYNAGRKTIKAYLLKNGVNDIDLAIPSIIDQRQYLGLFQLSGCFDVHRNLVWAKAGDCVEYSKDCVIEVLWPEKINTGDLKSEDNRRVIKIHCDGASCIVYGGLNKKNEEAFLKKYSRTDALCCDIVKISMPQFGKISVSDFMTASGANYAVVSCGGLDEESYDEMIENIERKDIIFYRTDLLGAVGIIIEKENISVCTQQKNMLLRHLQKN